MAISFATSDWADALLAAVRTDSAVRVASVTWIHGPLLLIIDADPKEGMAEPAALKLDVHEGEVRDIRCIGEVDIARTPFVIGGSYKRMKELLTGQLDLVDGILASKLRAKGDLPAIFRHRDLFTALAGATAELDTAWPEPAAEPATA